jgi:hypothetical protein
VLLTRSPLGHLPEGRASLDLHVLSTPPAFVLSQDQTLRECLYDSRPKPVCRHLESHRPATVSITGHTSWVYPPSARSGRCFLARCTKGIVHGRPKDRTRTRVIYGTNFRHAVEFSRSGRTPSQPFPADPGQPEILYPVSSARSNTTGTARTPTWSGRLEEPGASCLGEHPPGPAASFASRLTRLLRLRPADKENISQAGAGMQIHRPERSTPRICWARAVQAPRGQGHDLGFDFCDLGHSPAPATGPQTSRTALRLPDASTRPTRSARAASYCLAGTAVPSTRTAPPSTSRRAALVLAARPLATSSAGR